MDSESKVHKDIETTKAFPLALIHLLFEIGFEAKPRQVLRGYIYSLHSVSTSSVNNEKKSLAAMHTRCQLSKAR